MDNASRPAIIEVIASISLGMAFLIFVLTSIVYRTWARRRALRSRYIRFDPNHFLSKNRSSKDERRQVIVSSVVKSERIIENPPQYGRRLPPVLQNDAKRECERMLGRLREAVNSTTAAASAAAVSSAANSANYASPSAPMLPRGAAAIPLGGGGGKKNRAIAGSFLISLGQTRRSLYDTARQSAAILSSSTTATTASTATTPFHTFRGTFSAAFPPPSSPPSPLAPQHQQQSSQQQQHRMMPTMRIALAQLKGLYDPVQAADFLHTYEHILYGPPCEAWPAYIAHEDLRRMRVFFDKLLAEIVR